MKRGQITLDTFLSKRRINEETQINTSTETKNDESCELQCHSSPLPVPVLEDKCETEQYLVASRDIGNYVGVIHSVHDKLKYELITNPWTPPKDLVLPFSIHNKKGKQEKRYLNHSHLEKFHWLVYSEIKKGLFCKFCAIFVPGFVSGSNKHVALQKLVVKPLTTFAKLLGKDGDLCIHERHQYHKDAVESAQHFIKSYHEPSNNILNKINVQRNRQVHENIEGLKPIVETIIFLGRQNIPLRGHRDDGRLFSEADGTETEQPIANEGNFRELLRYRVNSGDLILENHLKNSSAKATYISKTVQNELIACCGEEIIDVILERVKQAKYYCVIFDETTDLSHTSQLSICLSYVQQINRTRV